MAAGLRAAEGGKYIFSKSTEGVFSKIFRPGGYTHYPLFPTPAVKYAYKILVQFNFPWNKIFWCFYFRTKPAVEKGVHIPHKKKFGALPLPFDPELIHYSTKRTIPTVLWKFSRRAPGYFHDIQIEDFKLNHCANPNRYTTMQNFIRI